MDPALNWQELQDGIVSLSHRRQILTIRSKVRDTLTDDISSILKSREVFEEKKELLREKRARNRHLRAMIAQKREKLTKDRINVESEYKRLTLKAEIVFSAGKLLNKAQSRLRDAETLLGSEISQNQVKKMESSLSWRRNRLIGQVSTLFSISTSHLLSAAANREAMDAKSSIEPQGSFQESSSEHSKDSTPVIHRLGSRGMATIVGCIVHALFLISCYLGVPLRYPVLPAASHSVIADPSIGSQKDEVAVQSCGEIWSHARRLTHLGSQMKLTLEGQETSVQKFQQGIDLLAKDLEQLQLCYGIGAHSQFLESMEGFVKALQMSPS